MIRYFFIFTLLLVSSINAQKPGRVRQLSFSDITTDSITASWKIPADSGDSPLAGFRVAYTIKDQNDWKKSSWITSRSYQFVNLQAGTTYSFAVQAKNQNGKLSSWRIGEETTSPVSNPSIPRNLNLDNAESMVLSINWNLPSDNGGSVVNRCRVRHKNTSADSTDYVFTAWMAATSYMIMDLSPNTDYHVGVQCRNKDGLKSPWLTEMFSTIIDAPSLPKDLAPTARDYDSITISWSEPESDGGEEINGYQIRWKKVGDSTYKRTGWILPYPMRHIINNLDENTEYEIGIHARNSVANGDWETIILFTQFECTQFLEGFNDGIDSTIPEVSAEYNGGKISFSSTGKYVGPYDGAKILFAPNEVLQKFTVRLITGNYNVEAFLEFYVDGNLDTPLTYQLTSVTPTAWADFDMLFIMTNALGISPQSTLNLFKIRGVSNDPDTAYNTLFITTITANTCDISQTPSPTPAPTTPAPTTPSPTPSPTYDDAVMYWFESFDGGLNLPEFSSGAGINGGVKFQNNYAYIPLYAYLVFKPETPLTKVTMWAYSAYAKPLDLWWYYTPFASTSELGKNTFINPGAGTTWKEFDLWASSGLDSTVTINRLVIQGSRLSTNELVCNDFYAESPPL